MGFGDHDSSSCTVSSLLLVFLYGLFLCVLFSVWRCGFGLVLVGFVGVLRLKSQMMEAEELAME